MKGCAGDAAKQAMCSGIIELANFYGARTVAEGVESAEVLTALALIGVDFAQGNWVRRAVPLVQIHTVVGSLDDSGMQRTLQVPLVSAR